MNTGLAVMKFMVSQTRKRNIHNVGHPHVIDEITRWKIAQELKAKHLRQVNIAEKYGVTRQNVADIARRIRAGRQP